MQQVSLMIKILPERQQIFNFFVDLGYQHDRRSFLPRKIIQIGEIGQLNVHEPSPCINRQRYLIRHLMQESCCPVEEHLCVLTWDILCQA